MPTIAGTTADETLTGTDAGDIITELTTPRSGNDIVLGLGGDDAIYAGTESNDSDQRLSVDGGTGADQIHYRLDNAAGLTSATLAGGDGDDIFYLDAQTTYGIGTGATIAVSGGAGYDIAYLGNTNLASTLAFDGIEQLVVVTGAQQAITLELSAAQIRGVTGTISVTAAGDLSDGNDRIFLVDGGRIDLATTHLRSLEIDLANVDTDLTATSGNDRIVLAGAHVVIDAGAGDDSVMGKLGAGSVVDGGSGSNSIYISASVSGASLDLDDLATAGGINLPDGSRIADFQKYGLSFTGNDNVVHAGRGGGGVTLDGVDNVVYTGAGNDSVSASTVYVSAGGNDNASATDITHIDYSMASASVRMQNVAYYDNKLWSYIDYSYAWIGGRPDTFMGATDSVKFSGNADVLAGDFDDILVGDLSVAKRYSVNLDGGAGDDIITPGIYDATFDGGSGNDTLSFANAAYGATPGEGVLLDLGVLGPQYDGFGSSVFTGFENVTGSAGDDRITGDMGRNLLLGGAGNDRLDGGGGGDATIYSGLASSYAIAFANGSGTVSGTEGRDTLISIETLTFADATLSSDADGPAAEVYRLYEAALGRAPDRGGLDNWTTALDKGMTLAALTQAFVDSDEFARHFADTSNDAFVSELYRTAFHREADDSGRAVYDRALDDGVVTRTQLVSLFAQSDEERADTADTVAAGLWTQDEARNAIVLLYDAALHRAPDADGLAAFEQAYAGGLGLRAIAEAMSQSQEFYRQYGFLDDSAFVDALYRDSLGRAADDAGKAFYVDELANGASRGLLVYQFAGSAEHIQHAGYQANTLFT